MAKSDPNRSKPDAAAGSKPALPILSATMCLPAGGRVGDMAFWDGFNWIIIPYPTNPDGQIFKAGQDGPFWANP